MKQVIVILEDNKDYREFAKQLIALWNPNVGCFLVETAPEAQEAIAHPSAWLRERPIGGVGQPFQIDPNDTEELVVVGAIVDLLIESASDEQRGNEVEQGKDFIKWLRANPQFTQLPILVLSSYVEMIIEVERAFHLTNGADHRTMSVVNRLRKISRIRRSIQDFVAGLQTT